MIFLTFANNPKSFLPELELEQQQIQGLLDSSKIENKVYHSDPQFLLEGFRKFRKSIKIFHFGGHGNPRSINVNSISEETTIPISDQQLNDLLIATDNLHLIFLNSCYSWSMVDTLLKRSRNGQGPKVFIYTEGGIFDNKARKFAFEFYSNLVSKYTIEDSFLMAIASIGVSEESASKRIFDVNSRDIIADGVQRANDKWGLFYREKNYIHWNLDKIFSRSPNSLSTAPSKSIKLLFLGWRYYEKLELYLSSLIESGKVSTFAFRFSEILNKLVQIESELNYCDAIIILINREFINAYSDTKSFLNILKIL